MPLPRVVGGVVLVSVNVTVPVGVPVPGATADTVAVNVTDWPDTDGLPDDVTDVEVVILLTVCVRVKVFAALFESPEYAAVIVCCPNASDDILTEA